MEREGGSNKIARNVEKCELSMEREGGSTKIARNVAKCELSMEKKGHGTTTQMISPATSKMRTLEGKGTWATCCLC